ncbi:MAG: hypothetical protein ACRC2M_09415, partial [Planktothrix sp.]
MDDPVTWKPKDFSNLCNLIDEGKKIGAGKIGNVFRVKIKDHYYVAKISKHQNYERELTDTAPSAIVLDGLPQVVIKCLTQSELPEQYLGLDEFSNEAIIAYFLKAVTEQFELPAFYLIHYNAYTCQKGLIHLMEEAELGTLDQFGYGPLTNKYMRLTLFRGRRMMLIPPALTLEIIKQIVLFLIFAMQNLGFVSGDLKAANIFLAGESISVQHQDELYNINIDCPFIVKVGDYGKSSITVPIGPEEESCQIPNKNFRKTNFSGKQRLSPGVFNTRIFNRNDLSEYYLKVRQPNFELKLLSDGGFGYVLNPTFIAEIFVYNRHTGTPYFRSLDFYTLIASMILLPQFQSSFQHPLLQRLWQVIWVGNEGRVILERAGIPDRSHNS